MKTIRGRLALPGALPAVAAAAVGLAIGVGGYTFLYAKGASYLSNDPKVCANCHVMRDQYNGWIKSTHHAAAVCNDCHTPHNFVGKYQTKASNGFWHSFYFTFDNFHEPIEISEANMKIVEANCRECHEETVAAMDATHVRESKLSCVRCHGSVGHPS